MFEEHRRYIKHYNSEVKDLIKQYYNKCYYFVIHQHEFINSYKTEVIQVATYNFFIHFFNHPLIICSK